jgi:heat shock protein beta
LKLGCIDDRENHKRLAPLLRFVSSQSENELIGLDEYVENMKTEQKDIYYIAADSVTSAKNMPFLERLIEKDLEVRACLPYKLGLSNYVMLRFSSGTYACFSYFCC